MNMLYFVQLMDICIVPSLGLSWIILQWIFTYNSLGRHMFSFLLGKYLGMELLNYMVSMYLLLKELSNSFIKRIYYITWPLAYDGSNFSLQPYQHLVLFFCFCFFLTILVIIEWSIILVSICISLMTGGIKHFLCNCRPIICFPWWNICSNYLSIFVWVVCLLVIEY